MAKEYDEQYSIDNASYKSIIKNYVKSQLIEPLRRYPTTVGDTLINVISSRLEELYLYTVRFPEIVSPNYSRLDILQAITEQFDFAIRKEADLEEQLEILNNILYVYKKRGSIDTIENMWKYYGGNLPKDIQVKIPSYNLFRYNLSRLSGNHVFQDGNTNRSGVYEVVINNTSNYSVDDLKEFMIKELVAAGNKIYFTHSLYSLMVGEDSQYNQYIMKNNLTRTEMQTVAIQTGLTLGGISGLSGSRDKSLLSGKPNIFLDMLRASLLYLLNFDTYRSITFFYSSVLELSTVALCNNAETISSIDVYTALNATYTPEGIQSWLNSHSYDRENNLILNKYPGFFVLGSTLLGSEVS